jgi:hypothetical protein
MGLAIEPTGGLAAIAEDLDAGDQGNATGGRDSAAIGMVALNGRIVAAPTDPA